MSLKTGEKRKVKTETSAINEVPSYESNYETQIPPKILKDAKTEALIETLDKNKFSDLNDCDIGAIGGFGYVVPKLYSNSLEVAIKAFFHFKESEFAEEYSILQ
jgi:hypothetical protein